MHHTSDEDKGDSNSNIVADHEFIMITRLKTNTREMMQMKTDEQQGHLWW